MQTGIIISSSLGFSSKAACCINIKVLSHGKASCIQLLYYIPCQYTQYIKLYESHNYSLSICLHIWIIYWQLLDQGMICPYWFHLPIHSLTPLLTPLGSGNDIPRSDVFYLSMVSPAVFNFCIIFLVSTHSISSCMNHTIIPSQFAYINSRQNGES
jgi:hypothetical protein